MERTGSATQGPEPGLAVVTRVGASDPGGPAEFQPRKGISEIEGKVTRVGVSELGSERVSIRKY
jgi:hypothetical protein